MRLRTLTAAVAGGATALAVAAYRKDLQEARERIGMGRQTIDSPHGPIEFGESGDGPAVLVIHGAGGGFDQGLDLGRAFLGEGHRIIAPSRFGYLGTPVPPNATPEAQADAHARVLDALQLETVPVIGVSAGGPSAMQFCLRHHERCSALILIVPLAFAPQHFAVNASRNPFFAAVLNTIASSDLLFWTATKIARTALLKTILGTPVEVYRDATARSQRTVDELLRAMHPMSKRIAGIANDGEVGSSLTRYALEDIHVPTLVITAADCLYGTYENSVYTAGQIRQATLVAFPSGGHLLLGRESDVRSQVTSFLAEVESGRKRMAMAG